MPALRVAPDLAVEVLADGNTIGEIRRKIDEYFRFGVQLVWIIDPRDFTAKVYTAPDVCVCLTETDTLTGGAVLPGFELPLANLFAYCPRPGDPDE